MNVAVCFKCYCPGMCLCVHTTTWTCEPHTGDFPFSYRLFNFASPPATKLSTAAPIDAKDKKV